MAFKLYLATLVLLTTVTQPLCACPGDLDCACSVSQLDYIVDCGSRDLAKIPESIPHNVTWLNLSHNALEAIGNSSFSKFVDLRVLDLSNNRIEHVDTGAFEGLGGVQRLDLSYNLLSTLSDQASDLFKPMENTVQIVELNNNRINTLSPASFQRCYRLSYLDLAFNQLTLNDLDIGVNSPSGLTHLDISGNPIGSIPYRFLNNLGALTSLTLLNASIENIDPNAFVDLKGSLRSLDLRNNKIWRLKREMFQPMRSGVFQGLSLSTNEIACDCGCKQFADWLGEFKPVIDSATCKSPDGSDYVIKDDDLTKFCPGGGSFTPDPDICKGNSSVTLTLLEVTGVTAYINIHQVELKANSALTLQLKVNQGQQEVIKTYETSVSDVLQEFSGLEPQTGYTVCAFQRDCVVWHCLTFSTTNHNPTLLEVSHCENVRLVIGLTIGGCLVCFAVVLLVLFLVFHTSCLKNKNYGATGSNNFRYSKRRSVKYGASVYSENGEDNNYEAIPHGREGLGKYDMPDEKQMFGSRGALPPTPAQVEIGLTTLPAKKKPVHFVRDKNFVHQGTAAHGGSLPELRDSTSSGTTSLTSGGSPATSGNHDRNAVPLPAIPESSIRRRELAEPYLEPTLGGSAKGRRGDSNAAPANQRISTIAHAQLPVHLQTNLPHYEPQFQRNTTDLQTYLEPTNNNVNKQNFNLTSDPILTPSDLLLTPNALDLNLALNPGRQTADFTRGISLKFYNRQSESDSTGADY